MKRRNEADEEWSGQLGEPLRLVRQNAKQLVRRLEEAVDLPRYGRQETNFLRAEVVDGGQRPTPLHEMADVEAGGVAPSRPKVYSRSFARQGDLSARASGPMLAIAVG